MRCCVKRLNRILMVLAVLLLTACKVELYAGISQKEGNEMLALLRTEGIWAAKQPDKDGKVKLLVEESDIAEAIDALKRKGYPRESFSTLKDVFPKEGLISSPVEERARLNYAKAQEISRTLSEIDGVLVARVHVVLPEDRDGLGKKSSPASASVFIKHAADIQLDAYIPQIKQLVNNGIEGLSYDRISVVLVPSADVRQVPLAPRYETVFSIQVTEESRSRLLGLFGLMVALLLVSNLGQYVWQRSRLS
ncbi:type III secretion system inner membrane ring lipoprotein SctJ [Pseudomonas gessardii]|uniref:Lipoprotein n=1 Tax=Pseudomonas gessardii TaxID=78544 RepID=A0A7Y1MQ33_9PSED|nr:type III secretion inner membrane ring lipoprotein SctJ [Pseudomonas gessardii]MBH3422470.1 type III secretion inner membrane ring lipoprotein SctJ [Pseudomonas gessardii]MRU51625.1 EscJ/YscJ/HrcJ family type III secretion inner membrane ring protein [Pseudomonas gessardii]NNA67888.1 type III secretion inner membrane ring lipoprotein SctJ [Pseudomonas gessardii]NNA96235.1 type III secretion inner membrane ring lipoprotein SctJ [Pseudomonas gessardii]